MSNNTSTEQGWLTPNGSDPVYDEELDKLLSQWVRNITLLTARRVIARWQPEPPDIPPADVNWCAFGVVDMPCDDNPAFVNQTDDNTVLWRHEIIECLASFYGPEWVRRYDFTVRLRRKVVREYNIRSLIDAPFTLSGE